MNATDTDLDAIIAKLSSLQALADKAGTPGEAAAATAAIQRLLFKYNLDVAQIRVKGDARVGEAYVDTQTTIQADLGATRNVWRRYLLQAVADANFCLVLFRAGTVRQFEFIGRGNASVIGRPANASVVLEMYNYLEREAIRQEKVAWKREGAAFVRLFAHKSNTQRRVLFARSFFMGFVQTVSSRLQEQKRASVAEAGTAGSTLVVQTDAELANALRELYPVTRTSRATGGRVASDAAHLGRAAGRAVNLNSQIGANVAGRIALR